MNGRKVLQHALRGWTGSWFALAAITAASSLLTILIPLGTLQILGRLSGMRHGLGVGILLLAVALLFQMILRALRSKIAIHLQTRTGEALQQLLWKCLAAVPVSLFRKFSVGELAWRTTHVQQLGQLLTIPAAEAAIAFVFCITSCIALTFVSLWLFGATLLCIVIALVIAAVAARWQLIHSPYAANARGRQFGLTGELLARKDKLQIAAAEQRALSRWSEEAIRREELQAKLAFPETIIGMLAALLPTAGQALLLGGVVIGAAPFGPASGELIAGLWIFGFVASNLLDCCVNAVGLVQMIPALQQLQPLFDEPPECLGTLSARLMGHIELRGVTFRYPGEMCPALDSVSLRVAPGEVLAITGRSGSGKTTLLRLLLGFETPDEGGVFYDDRNIFDHDLPSLRRQIGVVLQDGAILPGTVRSNIDVHGDLSENAIDEAVFAAALDEEITSLPMGLETPLRYGGIGLSGGQKQRILLARAIARKPAILLLDEATSALDNCLQRTAMERLRKRQVTCILIAHRFSTLTQADRIVVLDQGRIADSGSFQELRMHHADLGGGQDCFQIHGERTYGADQSRLFTDSNCR